MSKLILLGIGRTSHAESKGNITIKMEFVAGGSFANVQVIEDGRTVFSHTDMSTWTIAQMFAAKKEEYGF